MDHSQTVLVVDDSRVIRKILCSTLAEDFNLLEASNGVEAIDLIQQHRGILSAVLLDLVMPDLDGFQVLSFLKQAGYLESLPVLMITADDSADTISLAFDMGASEVIQKPFNQNIVKRRVKNLTDLFTQKKRLQEIVFRQVSELEAQELKLKENSNVMIDSLSTVIEYRSLESGQHIRRIRGFTKILLDFIAENIPGRRFTPEQIDMISRASAMHDIGKIAIPDSVLLKPGPLTPEEFDVMKTHTTKGCEILYRFNGINDQEYLSCCHDICLYHHERWDGSGYPDHLVGDNIPIAAQVVSVADVFDALTHKRVYKESYSLDKAIDMILGGKCGPLSPVLLECFRRTLPEFIHLAETYRDDDY